MANIEKMLKVALFDGILECPYFQYSNLELNYERCPECQRPNPLGKEVYI
ncbi:MAG: hypothetical protein ACFFDH_10695 [Promethearchaeota archaeon]